MKVSHVFLQLSSEDREGLVAFYRDVVGLPAREGMGPDSFDLGENVTLGVAEHSDTYGLAKEPSRLIVDLWVDDIDAEQTRMDAAGVRFIRDKGLEFWGGVISTFHDPDGNLVQLIQYRPELAKMEESAGVIV